MRINKESSRSMLSMVSMSLKVLSPHFPSKPMRLSGTQLMYSATSIKREKFRTGKSSLKSGLYLKYVLLSFPRTWLQKSWLFYVSFDAKK